MIWALYATLGTNMWTVERQKIDYTDSAWDKIVDAAHEAKLNMIVLDLGEGVRWGSHPELAKEGAWTRTRVRQEVKRLKELGITLIPKMNFSATHDLWLGEYRYMMCTKTYYQVCRDLITEAYELFDHPEYIHLGMDEEANHAILSGHSGLIRFRRGEQLWHDLQFLIDCVRDAGATPWIWSDNCFEHPEEFRAHIPASDGIMLSPWYYLALKEEHYTVIDEVEMYREYYSKPPYDKMDLYYVEDDPFCVLFREQAIKAAKDGYGVVPCGSTYNKIEENHDDLVDYFKTNAPASSVKGFMTAPWLHTVDDKVDEIIRGIKKLADAREKYYSGE